VWQDGDGEIALHYALEKNNALIAGMLLESGKINLAVTNKEGLNLIHQAAAVGEHV